MATLWNEKTLAAVSRETPKKARNSQSENTLDPEMAQEYISQASREIEGRVTKKNFQKKSAGWSHVFWVLCLNLMNFF